MKKKSKILLILLLILAIVTSILTGTLAVYNVQLDEIEGTLVAKTFIFKNDTYQGKWSQTTSIAPNEEEIYIFKITNTKDGATSETDITADMNFALEASSGKTQIGGLTILKIEESSNGTDWINITASGAIENGLGTLTYSKDLNKDVEQTYYYKVTIKWIASDNDNNYMNCSTTFKVTGNAFQKA